MAASGGVVLTLLFIYAYFTGRLFITPELAIGFGLISWGGSFTIMLMIATGYSERFTDPGNAKTPIVALTANALDGDKQKCLEAGMSDYMSNSVKVEQLKTMLSSYVS
ncbi:MAG: hypothetical protein HRU20_00640 [Pseudomonadales bacterium]|nr:hypothetical protein [Pseudomonadales bacterium]